MGLNSYNVDTENGSWLPLTQAPLSPLDSAGTVTGSFTDNTSFHIRLAVHSYLEVFTKKTFLPSDTRVSSPN